MLATTDLPPPPVAAQPILDLDVAGARLRAQPAYRQAGHAAATLVRERDLRVVLIELGAGGCLPVHHTVARVSIQAVRGRVRLQVGGATVTLAAGQLLVLDGGVAHDVTADRDSALLLTIAWHGAVT